MRTGSWHSLGLLLYLAGAQFTLGQGGADAQQTSLGSLLGWQVGWRARRALVAQGPSCFKASRDDIMLIFTGPLLRRYTAGTIQGSGALPS